MTLSSCYDSYVKDYDVVGVGFANQSDVRSVVVGESMEISTGIALGGVISNNENRRVGFATDHTIVTDALFSSLATHKFSYIQALAKQMDHVEVMPASMYSLTTEAQPGVALIRKGSHLGKITIKIDSAAFLADTGNLLPVMMVPLRITDPGSASLIAGYETTVIGIRYENRFFGEWWHGGELYRDLAGERVDTIKYHTTIPQEELKVWTLSTVAPYELTSNAIGSELNQEVTPMLRLLADKDGSIAVSAADGCPYTVVDEGGSCFNNAKLLQERKLYLNYSYEKDGYVCHARDTLTFRARIRDGVNEWQDEDPEKYK